MINRLTAVAACFAILAAASLASATGSRGNAAAMRAVTAPAQVVQLERVVVTAKRLPAASR